VFELNQSNNFFMHKKLILLICSLFVSFNAIAQWNSLNALSGSGTDSYDYNLLAVSDNGKNIAAYTFKSVMTPFSLSYIYVVSNDYGATWYEHPAPNSMPYQLFWDEDKLFVAETNTTDLKSSSDFGATFSVHYTGLYVVGFATNIFRLSATNWIVTKKFGSIDHLMQSTDKGVTWTDMGAITGFPVFFSYVVANNGNLISMTGGGVGYSSDNGLTWQNSTLPTTIQITNRHKFSKAPNGDLLMYVHLYGLFKSQDNGVTWQTVTTSLPTNASNCAFQGSEVICISSDASTHISTNNGVSFTQLTAANQLYTSGIIGSIILEKTPNNLYTSGRNKIYIYGTAPSSISNTTEQIHFNISPNPSLDMIVLGGLNTNEKLDYKIVSIDGRLMKQTTLTSTSLDVSDLNSGYYFIQIKNKQNKVGTMSFIKK
jgi:hypothetical protein